MQQKNQDDEGDREAFLHQLMLQIVDGTFDEGRAVVDGDDLHAFRQTTLQAGKFRLHPSDHIQRILAISHDDDAGYRLAFTVELNDTTAQCRSFDDACKIAQLNRCAAFGFQHNLFEIYTVIDIAGRADDKLSLALLKDTAANLPRSCANCVDQSCDGYIEAAQPVGVN